MDPRRRTVLRAAAALGISGAGVAWLDRTGFASADTSPAVFVTPHQDDEVLAGGPLLTLLLDAGRPCHVVGLTNGNATGVGPKLGLTKAQTATARWLEQTAADQALIGEAPVSLGFVNDGTLTADEAEEVFGLLVHLMPGALIMTTSQHDIHADHKAAALGLSRQVTRYGVDHRYCLSQSNDGAATVLTTDVVPMITPAYTRLSSAVTEYRLVDVPNGRYGIAGQSVPAQFDHILSVPTTYEVEK